MSISGLFLFIVEKHFMVWMYHSSFTHSLKDIWFVLSFWLLLGKAAVNIHVTVFLVCVNRSLDFSGIKTQE